MNQNPQVRKVSSTFKQTDTPTLIKHVTVADLYHDEDNWREKH